MAEKPVRKWDVLVNEVDRENYRVDLFATPEIIEQCKEFGTIRFTVENNRYNFYVDRRFDLQQVINYILSR